jgi:hypothetical protein
MAPLVPYEFDTLALSSADWASRLYRRIRTAPDAPCASRPPFRPRPRYFLTLHASSAASAAASIGRKLTSTLATGSRFAPILRQSRMTSWAG